MKKIYLIILVIAFCGLEEAICQWATNGIHIYNTNSGNVGIGSDAPSTLLNVSRNMTEPTVTVRNLGGSGGATYTMIDDASGANWKFKATLSGGFKIRDHANALDVIVIEPNSVAGALYVNSAGNVGIGTSAPGSALNVSGRNIELADWVFLGRMYSGADLLLGHNMKAIDDVNTRGAYVANNSLYGYSGIRMYSGDIQFHTMGGSVNAGDLASNQRMRITSDGKVGIGTSSPASSALVDMSSTSKGFLPPRLSSWEIAAIESPADGLMVYNTSDSHFYYYTSLTSSWRRMAIENEIWSCGDPITVIHSAGDVAPVSKQVTYGTVYNIPGAFSKCWITSNLGADQQATAVDDDTEASAGWYWQFNRQQGYKHDGTTRTPNTEWIEVIHEESDWLAASDPCALLLGSGWRLPTYTEYYNIDNVGEWSGPDAWNSALKLHAAGAIYWNGNVLYERGHYGDYWSSTQNANWNSWVLGIHAGGGCYTSYEGKIWGYTIRCLRDL